MNKMVKVSIITVITIMIGLLIGLVITEDKNSSEAVAKGLGENVNKVANNIEENKVGIVRKEQYRNDERDLKKAQEEKNDEKQENDKKQEDDEEQEDKSLRNSEETSENNEKAAGKEKKTETTQDSNKKDVKENVVANKSYDKENNKKNESTSKPAQPVKKQPVITTKTTTATETIGFKTETKNDSSLEKGKTKVVREGQNGTLTITYKETYKDGKLSSKDKVSSKVTKNPVNKVVHVGTKAPAPAYLSASQAHSILAGSGMKRIGNEYALQSVHGQAVKVVVGSNHVSSIHHNTTSYISMGGMTKQELIDMLGPVEGQKEYEYGLKVRAEIEKAVRAAANAVYGSGTSKANSLYNELVNSWDSVEKKF